MSFDKKVHLLSSLYKHRFDGQEPHNELKEVTKRLKEVNQKRNTMIHSVWLAGGVRSKTTAKEKRGLNFDFEEMTSNDISLIADFIAEVNSDVQKFFLSFSSARDTSIREKD